ncbi:MAG: hypothetical protein IKS65_00560 [Bacteroidales bacterium]|nr:hypothetical protein [Bacteroidales bacterium]
MKKIFLILAFLACSTTAFSQETGSDFYINFIDWNIQRFVVDHNENWKGYYKSDAVIEYNFDEVKAINSIRIRFLANPSVGISLPATAKVYAFPIDAPDLPDTFVKTLKIDEKVNNSGNQFFTEEIKLNGLKTKYLRIVVENTGSLMYISEPVIETTYSNNYLPQ